jgi:hypothetical protein
MLEKLKRLFKSAEPSPAIPSDLWVVTVEEISPKRRPAFWTVKPSRWRPDLRVCTWELEGIPVIPLFSSSDGAGTFINGLVKRWKQDIPDISNAAFGVVRMRRAVLFQELFQQILATPGVLPILDPLTPAERRLTQADLRKGAQ